MKKYFVMALIISVGYTASAQSSSVFEKGTNVINVGIGFGDLYWGAGTTSIPISFNGSFDHGITDKLGIGYIGVGGKLGYTDAKYSGGITATGFLIDARAPYHFALASDIGDKLDPYVGADLGYVITSYSGNFPSSKASSIAAGAFAGAHYYFTPNFGAYAEISSTFSLFSTGLTFKF